MRLILLQVDDWEALYIDGALHDENHSLNLSHVLEAVAKQFEKGEDLTFESFMNEETEGAYYPDKLEEVEPHLRGDISV